MMGEWKERTFSKWVSISPQVKLVKGQYYSFVEMKDLEPSNKFCEPSLKRVLTGGARFEEGDTLFARITPCLENGKICKVRNLENGVGFGSTEFLVFRGIPDISDTDFVYYLSRWNEVREFAEINLHGTSGRQRVPKEAFSELLLTLPPLSEQQAIAEVLSSLDDKIDLLHRNNRTLEEIADTLFRQWRNSHDHLVLGTIKDYLHIQGGYAFKSEHFKEQGDAGIIKITNISDGVVDVFNTQYVSKSVVENLDIKFRIQPTDFLIAMTGAEIGKLGVVEETKRELWLNQRVGKLVDKVPGSTYIGYLALRSGEGQDHIVNTASGSAQENISTSGIEALSFPKIDPHEFEKFGKGLKYFFDKIVVNLGQVSTLTSIRETLLLKLMSGELQIKD